MSGKFKEFSADRVNSVWTFLLYQEGRDAIKTLLKVDTFFRWCVGGWGLDKWKAKNT